MVKSAYSLTRHLAYGLFTKYDDEHALMAMLNAYFDASEQQYGTRVMTVAGFVSTVKKWGKFESEWNTVLKKYEVPYLHMKEFNGTTGAFEKWNELTEEDLKERKKQFLTELIKVAKYRIHKGFSSSIRLVDFEDVNRDFMFRERWGCAYSFLGMAVIASVRKWKQKHFPDAKIRYIFEDGDSGQENLRRCLNAEELPYAFPPKKEKQNGIVRYVTQFQIADFAAWENQALYSRLHDGKYKDIDPGVSLDGLRGSFQALYKQLPIVPKAFTPQKLRHLGIAYKLNRSASFLSPAVDTHSF